MFESDPHIQSVHLAIDVQGDFLQPLQSGRATSLPLAIRGFADEIVKLPNSIPTIWVVCGDGYDYGVCEHSERYPDSLKDIADHHGLEFSLLRKGEIICIKNGADAFGERALRHYLNETYPALSRVFVTGLNTRLCVVDTMLGARRQSLEVVGVHDLMGDSNYASMDLKSQVDPLKTSTWHRQCLLEILKRDHQAEGVHLMDSEHCLRFLRRKPSLEYSCARPGHGAVQAGVGAFLQCNAG